MADRVIRAWWAHRQGLDGVLAGAPVAEVLERTGWQRSLGGLSLYLPIFARAGGTRAVVDNAVAALEVHELPSARGCMYLVPGAHCALALRLGQGRSAAEAVATLETYLGSYLRDGTSDARTFTLDDPKRRAPRIAALRAMAGAAVR